MLWSRSRGRALGVLIGVALIGSAWPAAAPVGAANFCVNPGGTGGCLPTIQAAVTAAVTSGQPSSIITVADGVYREAVGIAVPAGMAVAVQAAGSGAVIDGKTGAVQTVVGTLVTISAGAGGSVTLSGLTIQHGQGGSASGGAPGQAGALLVTGGTVLLQRLVVQTNSGGSAATINDSVGAGGLGVVGGNVTVTDSAFIGNQGASGGNAGGGGAGAIGNGGGSSAFGPATNGGGGAVFVARTVFTNNVGGGAGPQSVGGGGAGAGAIGGGVAVARGSAPGTGGGVTSVTDSTFTGNVGGGTGLSGGAGAGAIGGGGGQATAPVAPAGGAGAVSRSTFVGNVGGATVSGFGNAGGAGAGAIGGGGGGEGDLAASPPGGVATLSNSTFVGNVGGSGTSGAGAGAGAIGGGGGGSLGFGFGSGGGVSGVAGFVTFSQNQGGTADGGSAGLPGANAVGGGDSGNLVGGARGPGGTATLTAAAVAGGVAGPNCAASAHSTGYTVSSDATCVSVATDVANAEPLLGPLANHGGPTQTMVPQSLSPAINRVPLAACPAGTVDQRGADRPEPGGTACDAGAVEVLPVPTVASISPASGPTGGGTLVTIIGTGFATAPGSTAVRFGVAAATSVACVSATLCYATAPPGAGTVDLVVSVVGQASAANPADQFTYVAATATATPTATATATATTTATAATATTTPTATATATPTGTSVANGGLGELRLIQPVRVLDTRPSDAAAGITTTGYLANGLPLRSAAAAGRSQPLADGSVTRWKLTGVAFANAGGAALAPITLAGDATGVLINVTIVQGGLAGGFVVVFPGDVPDAQRPNASTVNPGSGVNANFTAVRLGSDGTIAVANVGAARDVLIDLVGYYAPSNPATTGAFRFVGPVRVLDTRPSGGGIATTGFDQAGAAIVPGPLPAGQTRTFTLAGKRFGGVDFPADVGGILAHVTTIQPTGQGSGGFVTLLPGGAAGTPPTSTVNPVTAVAFNSWATAIPTAGPAQGQFSLFTTNALDVAVDVIGYWATSVTPAQSAGALTLTTPFRVIDTRSTSGGPIGFQPGGQPIAAGPFAAGSSRSFQLAGGSFAGGALPADARGVLVNVTLVQGAPGGGFVTVFPGDAAPATGASTVNPSTAIAASFAGSALGQAGVNAGTLGVTSVGGTRDVIVDVVGYFR